MLRLKPSTIPLVPPLGFRRRGRPCVGPTLLCSLTGHPLGHELAWHGRCRSDSCLERSPGCYISKCGRWRAILGPEGSKMPAPVTDRRSANPPPENTVKDTLTCPLGSHQVSIMGPSGLRFPRSTLAVSVLSTSSFRR